MYYLPVKVSTDICKGSQHAAVAGHTETKAAQSASVYEGNFGL